MWNYRIDEARGLVITTVWGVLTDADILAHRRKLRNDPRFRSGFLQLVDLTHVNGITLDYDAVEELSREHLFSRDSRRAFVAPNVVTYAMTHLFISLRMLAGGTERMEIFESRNKAVRWLFKPDSKPPSYTF